MMKKLLMVCISIVCCTFVVSANTSSERAVEGLKNFNNFILSINTGIEKIAANKLIKESDINKSTRKFSLANYGLSKLKKAYNNGIIQPIPNYLHFKLFPSK